MGKKPFNVNFSNRQITRMALNKFATHPNLRVFTPSRHSRFGLFLLLLFITACGAEPTPAPIPTETATLIPTATATSIPSPTPTVTPTPQPAWYMPLDPGLGLLKYKYAEVIDPQAKVYRTLEDAVAATGNFGYLPNSPAYVSIFEEQTRDDRKFDLVYYGWMEADKLSPLTPSTFTGILITRPVDFRFGWVLAETQSVNTAGMPVQTYRRYQIVYEVPAVTENPGFIAVGANEWLPDASVALVSPQVPEEVGEICRFIHVDLSEQTLGVYENCQLKFATLISSGQNSLWTFAGRFGITYKVTYSNITPPNGSTSEYYIEGVPYFMTYYGNLGFHGAYWHNNFGTPASHGCINLSPADARWLYDWSYIGEYVFITE